MGRRPWEAVSKFLRQDAGEDHERSFFERPARRPSQILKALRPICRPISLARWTIISLSVMSCSARSFRPRSSHADRGKNSDASPVIVQTARSASPGRPSGWQSICPPRAELLPGERKDRPIKPADLVIANRRSALWPSFPSCEENFASDSTQIVTSNPIHRSMDVLLAGQAAT